MKKKIIVFLSLILIVGAAIAFYMFYSNRNLRPEGVDYIAYIYHSEMLGMDAGNEYMYYFYPNEDGTYLYVKAESEVTIAGSGEAKDVKSGKIKEKADFEKIKTDIAQNEMTNTMQYLKCIYKNGEVVEEYYSVDELANKLFK